MRRTTAAQYDTTSGAFSPTPKDGGGRVARLEGTGKPIASDRHSPFADVTSQASGAALLSSSYSY